MGWFRQQAIFDSMKLQASFDYSGNVTGSNLHPPTTASYTKGKQIDPEKSSLNQMDNYYEIISEKSLLPKDTLFYSKQMKHFKNRISRNFHPGAVPIKWLFFLSNKEKHITYITPNSAGGRGGGGRGGAGGGEEEYNCKRTARVEISWENRSERNCVKIPQKVEEYAEWGGDTQQDQIFCLQYISKW